MMPGIVLSFSTCPSKLMIDSKAMRTDTIEQSLLSLFSAETPIVFWDDEQGEFSEVLPLLPLEAHGITLIRRDEIGDLELKVMLELEKKGHYFLLYAPCAAPQPQDDWLLNIRLYSPIFSADTATILLGELGLESIRLRTHLSLRKKFLAAQERVQRLKRHITPQADEQELDMGILAVLVRAEQPDLHEILIRLFLEQYPEEAAVSPDMVTPLWNDVEKYGVTPFFWEKISTEFGYTGAPQTDGTAVPSLRHLLRCLLITDMGNSMRDRLPLSLAHFYLEGQQTRMASLFCNDWRRHRVWHRQLARISGIVARELNVQQAVAAHKAEELSDCSTFEEVERRIVTNIVQRAQTDTTESLLTIIRSRRQLYWAEWEEDGLLLYGVIYDGLEAMLAIRSLKEKYPNGFSYAHAAEAWAHYTDELFRLDQLYRHFCIAADKADSRSDALKEARHTVENWISGWYAGEISRAWAAVLAGDSGLLATWSLRDTPRQKDFYCTFPAPVVRENPRSRVFVVISDALRYEVAEELARTINHQARLKAELQSQLGVLPSITSLGMAALLPHDTLAFKPGSAEILVDKMPTATLEQRDAILARKGGRAIRSDDLVAMKTEEARAFIREIRVLYIYHNHIDSTGDSAASESQTFEAAEKTVQELTRLVRFIADRLNGSHIFITADHGFLYQEAPLEQTDKALVTSRASGVLKAKKRYMLGTELGDAAAIWHGNTAVTVGTAKDNSLEFWVPQGVGRFHFAGGARYTHGGALPQEIVLPVLHVRPLSGKAASQDILKRVEVCPLGQVTRIVNNIQKFEFIQTEKVSERCLPRTLLVSLSDGKASISDEKKLIFDSASEDMESRKKSVTLSLKNSPFDSRQAYWLILRDEDTQAEYLRIRMTIDLAFQNLF